MEVLTVETAKKLTPIRAIRAKCLDCSAGSAKEVRLCVIPDCPLYMYRMGKNPAYAGKKGNVEALRRYAESQKSSG